MEVVVKTTLLALLFYASAHAAAQVASASAKSEIEGLFAALENSGCEFERNGAWHGAGEASAHLRRKYDYLLRKDLVTSTESFIELAATKSSLSGKPYRVRCGDADPIASKDWFGGRLRTLRAGADAGA